MRMRWTTLGVCLLVVGIMLFAPHTAALAQEEALEVNPAYSKIEGISGDTFDFDVYLVYTGSEPGTFNLSATGPQNWTVYITPDYPQDKRIQDIRVEPNLSLGQGIVVNAIPPVWLITPPGEYKITLDVSSDTLQESVELTAVVTSSYEMALYTPDDLLNTSATAGKDNFFSIVVQNVGSAAIDNIALSSDKPRGWTIEFTPEKINALNSGSIQTVDVNIKPAPKAIAGDYEITLIAQGSQFAEDLSIRVTVETPTVWGWVGIGIIVLVFAGLGFVFIRFSRR